MSRNRWATAEALKLTKITAILIIGSVSVSCDSKSYDLFPGRAEGVRFFYENRDALNALIDKIEGDANVTGVTCYNDGNVVLRSRDGSPYYLDGEYERTQYLQFCESANIGLVWESDSESYVDGGSVENAGITFTTGLTRVKEGKSDQISCDEFQDLDEWGVCRFKLIEQWYQQYEWHPIPGLDDTEP